MFGGKPKIPTPKVVQPVAPPLEPSSPIPASSMTVAPGERLPEVAKGQTQLLGSLRRRPEQKRDRRALLGG
jgi:hypothetical protein